MKLLRIITLFLFLPYSITATTVSIGVLTSKKLTTVIFSPLYGDYVITADSSRILLDNKDLAYLTYSDGKIALKTLRGDMGTYSAMRIESVRETGTFKFKPVIPYGTLRSYDDDLEIRVVEQHLRIVNHVDLDKYVAGVVKSEVGIASSLELYKVQAIICRTYSLSNFRKHEEENYQLCDKVHCQVYAGRCAVTDPETGIMYAGAEKIAKAAEITSGIIIVDDNLELVTAAFHSNCGGQTANSEDVWSKPLPYLRSVKDTFCYRGRNARWKRRIPEQKWTSYLTKSYGLDPAASKFNENATTFAQGRRARYFAGNNKIPLHKIRTDWKFKSAYFSIYKQYEDLIFSGKGFGHGVGLCQQGAMRMSEYQIDYKKIIHHYYTDVTLIDIGSLKYLLK
ncbi:MAG TPA: SpoIID/LytB domain-containing protein [Flavobacteriales bacterium]|nr:SpoIID/LytB domain-containing protein [Flavobacteriales bacterium]HIA12030.1 SpoIID/LytB domain-containing protein [Flavobacteriales bacterium]